MNQRSALLQLSLIHILAIFAPLVAPYGYMEQDLLNRLQAPSAAHLLGTDELGRDAVSYTHLMEAFLVPAGTVLEVYATTLHYAPCHVDEKGFQCVVILPRNTNTDIEEKNVTGEDRLLLARNKWLIGHKEGGLPERAFIGLKGENLSID